MQVSSFPVTYIHKLTLACYSVIIIVIVIDIIGLSYTCLANCLYAVSVAELLNDVCYALSEEELVSDDSFFEWEKISKNGIALKSLTQFFKWLRTD